MQSQPALLMAALAVGAAALTLDAQSGGAQVDGGGIGPSQVGITDGPDQFDPLAKQRVDTVGSIGGGGAVVTGGPSYGGGRLSVGSIGDGQVIGTGGPSFGDKQVDAGGIGTDKICPNLFDSEPLVEYDISGGTLAGLYHLRVSVSSSGAVSVAEVDPVADEPIAAIQFLDELEVLALRDDLLAAGAGDLCDDTIHVIDAPIVTLTVFRADGTSHSSNYFREAGVGAWKDSDDLLQTFLAEKFPQVVE